MTQITNIFENIANSFSNPLVSESQIISILFVVLLISAYEFVVYRLVSHKSMYNKSFNISIAVIPFFIATIIMCLQSNVVITLGTIGALAIIRFRTAVKDPVDMLYLLWAVHTGITCGCQLYSVSLLTSLVVTIVLLVLENVSFSKKPYVLVFRCEKGKDKEILDIVTESSKKYRIKSRNISSKGMDYVIELSVKDASELTDKLANSSAERFSVIAYDTDDVM